MIPEGFVAKFYNVANGISLENLFFLTYAVGDLTKVRMAKSAREGSFSYSKLDVGDHK